MIMTDMIAKRNDAVAQRRFGRFYFSQELLNTHADVVQKIFAKVIPLDVTFDYTAAVFEVKACSTEFQPTEAGSSIPLYHVVVRMQKRNKGGSNRAYYLEFHMINGDDE